jgi:hypothetical protein
MDADSCSAAAATVCTFSEAWLAAAATTLDC